MTSFSKGPWSFKRKENSCIIENQEETYIADVHFWTEGAEKITVANASLIAAAPEMYELLDKINAAFYTRTSRKEWIDLMEQSRPLLKKARGANE